jgi:DUF1009 family protein
MPLAKQGPIAVIAGSGRLPVLVVEALARSGREHRVLGFRGFVCADLRRRADALVDILDVRTSLEYLRNWSPAAVTSAGGVRRPSASALLGAFSAFRNRREIADLVARGDDGLLRGMVGLVEGEGHTVVGVHELAPDLLARAGVQGGVRPDEHDERSIAAGIGLLGSLSAHDVGQAAVVVERRVLAVEGPEGTDRMLRRAGRLAAPWRPWRKQARGVLVKAVKKGQDLRVDMPAIGARTIVEAKRAGLRGVAIGAGSTIVIDRENTVDTANRLGLFLVGVDVPWTA